MCRLNRQHLAADAIIALVTLRRQIISAVQEELATWTTRPVHASLFGSAARGDGGPTSDLDVLVIRPDEADDELWSEQLYVSGVRLRAATGNAVSWFDLPGDGLATAVSRDEPLLRSWKADHVQLCGQRLEPLLRRGAPKPRKVLG